MTVITEIKELPKPLQHPRKIAPLEPHLKPATDMALHAAFAQLNSALDGVREKNNELARRYDEDNVQRAIKSVELNSDVCHLSAAVNELEQAIIANEDKFNKKLRTQESWTMVFGLLLVVLFIWTLVLTLK